MQMPLPRRYAQTFISMVGIGLLSGCSWIPFIHHGPNWTELDGTAQLSNSITVKTGNLDVALIDRNQNDATVAMTQVPVSGQWPLHFALMYDANNINDSHHYALITQLDNGGTKTYKSAAPTPALTQGAQANNIQLTLSPIRDAR
ncbi:hypothetical protein LMG33818_001928 [Halomonadaceae bacterium LMG 33818]|uniref:YbaY family lipoprotein n=1 Tax=Cernens ardua TaxID=3402176 RepID=UPI003EDCA438